MEILIIVLIVLSLLALDIAARLWGVDSRYNMDSTEEQRRAARTMA